MLLFRDLNSSMFASLRTRTRKILASFLLLTSEALLSLSLFIIAVIVFLAVAKYVFWDQKAEFDQHAFLFFESFINEDNNNLMAFFTIFGNYQFLVTANLLVIFYFLFIRKHKWYSIKIPAVALGSVSIMFLLKLWFSRPRPLTPLLGPAMGYSFPSGHAMSSVTFFGLLIYFIWKKPGLNVRFRYVLIILLVLLICIIGISRIYLRVHYASDVIAGFCVGVIWLVVSLNLLDRLERRNKTKLQELVQEQPPQT